MQGVSISVFISPYYLVAKEVSIVNDAVFNSATNCHLCVNHLVKYKYLPGAVQKLQSVECISRSALLALVIIHLQILRGAPGVPLTT